MKNGNSILSNVVLFCASFVTILVVWTLLSVLLDDNWSGDWAAVIRQGLGFAFICTCVNFVLFRGWGKGGKKKDGEE